jgi:hypothetical protein
MKKVVSVGALNVDVLLFVDEFCKPDGEVPVNSTSVCSGGQAGNIAAGLGKLGKNVFFFGNIGNDSHTANIQKPTYISQFGIFLFFKWLYCFLPVSYNTCKTTLSLLLLSIHFLTSG